MVPSHMDSTDWLDESAWGEEELPELRPGVEPAPVASVAADSLSKHLGQAPCEFVEVVHPVNLQPRKRQDAYPADREAVPSFCIAVMGRRVEVVFIAVIFYGHMCSGPEEVGVERSRRPGVPQADRRVEDGQRKAVSAILRIETQKHHRRGFARRCRSIQNPLSGPTQSSLAAHSRRRLQALADPRSVCKGSQVSDRAGAERQAVGVSAE